MTEWAKGKEGWSERGCTTGAIRMPSAYSRLLHNHVCSPYKVDGPTQVLSLLIISQSRLGRIELASDLEL